MVDGEAREQRKEKAVRLRLAGHSRSQIAHALGLRSGGPVGRWVRGIPAPEWTRRPNAKDELHQQAVEMRLEGRSYREIQAVLGVSKSTLSLWLRHVPLTEEHRVALDNRRLEAVQTRGAAIRAARMARERRIVEAAAAQVGALTDQELFIAGVVAYWAEGCKNKPGQQRRVMKFINSDPAMVILFLRWLDLLGVPRDAATFRVAIHETADLPAALRFWSGVVGVPSSRFKRSTLKRHNPKTVRKNVGADYHGCLRVEVRKSTDLNSQVQGWFAGIVANLPAAPPSEAPAIGATSTP